MSTHEDSNIRVRLRGGASIVHAKPLISHDSKWVYCASGEIIKVLSVSSGECLHVLRGHKGTITALKQNPHNQFQIYSASLDGSIKKWEATDGVLLKTYNLSGPLLSLLVSQDYFYATKMVTTERCDVIQFRLEGVKSCEKVKYETVLTNVPPKANSVSIGANGAFVAAVSHKILLVYNLKTKSVVPHHIDKEMAYTCVACHPTQYAIATGNESGRIFIWHNILSSTKATKEVRHWHALPVLDLHFTTDGSYFLSGGEECVLVKWQYASTHRDTLPRLGAPLLHVTTSLDGTHYATSHADNAIQVISSTFSVVQHFQGLTRGHLDTRNLLRTDLMLDPRSKSLVLNGRPGHLQFYNIHSDKQLFNLDIVSQNYVSPDNLKRPLAFTEVEKAAFDEAGDWLATVERRDDGKTTPEMKLKFWMYCTKTQTFVLNTCVDLPHDKAVSALKFRPSQSGRDLHQAVTTSFDGTYRLWELKDDTDIYRENTCWMCEYSGSYRKEPATVADFAEDGNTLAIAFEKTLTLWNPDSNSLNNYFNLETPIRHLLFGRGSCSHMLLVATETHLMSWNLNTLTVEWCEEMSVSFMLCQPSSINVAVFRQNNTILILTPADPSRIFLQAQLSEASVISAIFIPAKHPVATDSRLAWLNDLQLFFINSRQELLTLVDAAQEEEEDNMQTKLIQDLPTTVFSRLMAEKRVKAAAVHTTEEEQQKLQNTQFIKEILDTPAAVMPPVNSLCLSFLQTLMVRPKSASEKPKLKAAADTDSSSDEDSESDNDSDTEDSGIASDKQKDSTTEIMDTTTTTSTQWTEITGLDNITEKTFEWMAES